MKNYDDEEYSQNEDIKNAISTANDINNLNKWAKSFSKKANEKGSKANSKDYSKKHPQNGSNDASKFSSSANPKKGSTPSPFSSKSASASSDALTSTGSTASSATTSDAAAAASTGVGVPVAIIVFIASVIASSSKKASEEVTGESNIAIGIIILIFFALFILGAIILAPAIAIINTVMRPFIFAKEAYNTISESINYYVAEEVKEDYFEKYASQLSDLSNKDLDSEIYTHKELNEETIAVYKNIIDWSIYQAFSTYTYTYLTDLGTYKAFLFDGYSPQRTYEKFLKNPYPYKKRKNSTSKYVTIKDFIKTDFQTIMDDEMYNDDLNYAEIFTIVCQNENYSFDTFSYSDFYDLFVSKETAMLLFEMKISDEPTYYKLADGETLSDVSATKEYENASEEEMDDYLLNNVEDIDEELLFLGEEYLGNIGPKPSILNIAKMVWHILRSNKGKDKDKNGKAYDSLSDWASAWCNHFFFDYNVEVYPYGLEEIYKIAGLNYDDYNYRFISFKNYELLDYQEQWLRKICKTVYFGPSYSDRKTNLSSSYERHFLIFNEDRHYSVSYPTGRSPLCYIQNSYMNVEVLSNDYIPPWCNRGEVWHSTMFNLEKDTIVLDMYEYIYQGNYPDIKRGIYTGIGQDDRKSVAYEGCIDCCFIMIYEYFYRQKLNISLICQNYVNTKREFIYSAFCKDYCLLYGPKKAYFDPQYIENQIRLGNPVLIHIYGLWRSDKQELLHAGGGGDYGKGTDHYLIIVGFTEDGFIVMDPGNRINTNERVISVESFRHANQFFMRPIMKLNSLE